jgi:hypothetical protein
VLFLSMGDKYVSWFFGLPTFNSLDFDVVHVGEFSSSLFGYFLEA